MSKYTMQLREICEVESGKTESVGLSEVDEVIENSRRTIFGNYPIFNENYRGELERKIIKHYFMREIGFETVAQFKLKLNSKMNEIMPYYNKLYESEMLKFNPFEDTDLKTEKGSEETRVENEGKRNTRSEENSGISKDKSISNTERWNLISDTPQGELSDVKNGRYLTTAENQTTNNTEESESNNANIGNTRSEENKNRNISNIGDYVEKIKGKRGMKSYPQLLEEYRKTFLNIDLRIINELSDLFFLLW